MNSRLLLAPLLCASLSLPTSAAASLPPTTVGSVTASMALQRRAEPVVTSVLGLKSDDPKAAKGLTESLRRAFAEREMSGGQDLSLEEVVLTLDCSSEQDTACMAEAGRALETERLVYGSLTASGGGYVLDIIVLDVTTGQIEAQGTMPFDGDAMSSGNVDATATEVVNSLYPSAEAVPAAAPIDEDPTTEPEGPEEPIEPESGLVWGPYKPRPKWKKVGLGISIGILVAGVATAAIGGGLTAIYYPDKVKEAERALSTDDNENNNLVPMGDDELLELARAGKTWDPENPEPCAVATMPASIRFDETDPKAVINADVARDCRDGGRAATVANVGFAALGVGAASTILFSILYNVHRRKTPGTSARRRRTLHMSASPTRGGGFLRAGGRF